MVQYAGLLAGCSGHLCHHRRTDMGLTTIWFAGGAVIALIAALLGAGLEIQIGLFFVVSIILLFNTGSCL